MVKINQLNIIPPGVREKINILVRTNISQLLNEKIFCGLSWEEREESVDENYVTHIVCKSIFFGNVLDEYYILIYPGGSSIWKEIHYKNKNTLYNFTTYEVKFGVFKSQILSLGSKMKEKKTGNYVLHGTLHYRKDSKMEKEVYVYGELR